MKAIICFGSCSAPKVPGESAWMLQDRGQRNGFLFMQGTSVTEPQVLFFLLIKIRLKGELVPVFLLLHLTKKSWCAVHLLCALPFPTFIFVISSHSTSEGSQRAGCSMSCVFCLYGTTSASNQYHVFLNLANPLLLSWVFSFLMIIHVVTRCCELGQEKWWARVQW